MAKKYGLKAVYVFGSYARGEANENSDITLSVGTVEYSTVDTENGVLTFQPKISAYNSLDVVSSIENKNGRQFIFTGTTATTDAFPDSVTPAAACSAAA